MKKNIFGRYLIQIVNVTNFLDTTLVDFITNLFQLIGYTYIIAQLHWLIIVAIIIIIKFNSVLSEKREKMGYAFQPIVANFARKCTNLKPKIILKALVKSRTKK